MATVTSAVGGFPRVNLLPRSELARRERDRLTRVWVWAVLGALLIALLIIAGAFWLKWMADQRLATEQARTNQLLSEITALSDVSQALAAEAELTDFRAQAMVADLAWTPIIGTVVSVLPPDTNLTGFELTVGGAPQGADPTLEEGLAGTVTVDSPTPLDIVAIIRTLRAVDGVLYADGQSVTSSSLAPGRYAYQLNVQFDQTVYSGEYSTVDEDED